jgi:uncharacterized protein
MPTRSADTTMDKQPQDLAGGSRPFRGAATNDNARERVAAIYRGAAAGARKVVQRALAASAELATRLRPWLRGPRAAVARTTLTWIAVVLFGAYLGLGATLYVTQRSLLYFPETARTPPAAAGLPEAEEVTLTTSDSERIIGWHVPPGQGKPVIIYFHGNGGSLRYPAERFRKLVKDGIGLIAIDYRGFGGSSGSPSEAGLIADAEAAYAFAAARYPVQQLVLWGESLGSAVAVALAAEKPIHRVILEAPFTSAAAVAALRYWYMPVTLLMKDQFRSDERIGKITAPVLILHGLHDSIIPYAMGERLFALTTAPKHIVRFLDGDHEDLDANGALHAVGRFLAGDLDRPAARPPG